MKTNFLRFACSTSRILVAITMIVGLCAHSEAAPNKKRRSRNKKRTVAQRKVTSDYIVALVNSAPVTNQEVNQLANEMAKSFAANKQKVPARKELLAQALNDLIMQKAAIQSARRSTLTITPEEFRNAENILAQQQKLTPKDFRKQMMKKHRVSQAQYKKELIDQLLLEKMRKARISMASAKISKTEALQWLSEQDSSKMLSTQRHIRHILLKANNEKELQQAYKKLRSLRQRIARGKISFEAAARKFSQDSSASKGGDLGWTPIGVFVPEFDVEINKLKKGAMTPAFVSRFGVHIAQLLDEKNEAMTQEQKLQLAYEMLQEQKAQEALRKWEAEVRAGAYIEMRGQPS